jgi:D-tyrosyl-tRNA(Tyr) deacylase
MRAVIQRVKQSAVTVDGRLVGNIGMGLLVLLGVAADDGPKDAKFLAEKIIGLRIFEDATGKMNLSLTDVGGEMLVVSQFTLFGDCRKGRRPSFTAAAPPDLADFLYESFIDHVRQSGVIVKTGVFGAMMDVSLTNDGPVTLILDTRG